MCKKGLWLGTGHTRGSRPAAHGLACGVVRDCIPIVVQEGAVAGYWQSPAAGAMRLTADACGVARLLSADKPERRVI